MQIKKIYTRAKVGLLVALLSFNTLSSCGHTGQELGINKKKEKNEFLKLENLKKKQKRGSTISYQAMKMGMEKFCYDDKQIIWRSSQRQKERKKDIAVVIDPTELENNNAQHRGSKESFIYSGPRLTLSLVSLGVLVAAGWTIWAITTNFTENQKLENETTALTTLVPSETSTISRTDTVGSTITLLSTIAATVAATTRAITSTTTPNTIPEVTSTTMPDTTPEVTSTTMPDTTPEVTSTTMPDTTPEVTSTTMPDTTPEVTSTTMPDTTPEVTSTTMPDTTPEVTSTTTPDTTLDVTSTTTPDTKLDKTLRRVTKQDNRGQVKLDRALRRAVKQGDLDKVQKLLNNGANPYSIDKNGQIAKDFAWSSGRWDILDVLITAEEKWVKKYPDAKEKMVSDIKKLLND